MKDIISTTGVAGGAGEVLCTGQTTVAHTHNALGSGPSTATSSSTLAAHPLSNSGDGMLRSGGSFEGTAVAAGGQLGSGQSVCGPNTGGSGGYSSAGSPNACGHHLQHSHAHLNGNGPGAISGRLSSFPQSASGATQIPPSPSPLVLGCTASTTPQNTTHGSPPLPSINVKETLELLECPVCCDCMVPPIYQCREGHALCNDCLVKVKCCPACRNPVDVRCRVLDRLADSIGDVSCRFMSLGCQETMRYRFKKDHEQRCQFKFFPCLHADQGCKYEATAADLVEHLVAVHDYEKIQSNSINFCCNRKSVRLPEPISLEQQCVWQRQIYHCFDKYFVLRVHRRIDGDPAIYISLAAIHWKHHSNRYCISIQGNHRRYSFEGPVWSIRKGFKEIERVRDCLILPENIALFLSGGKGSENDLNLINLTVEGEILP